jgi:predicted nucleic acid-binding protein
MAALIFDASGIVKRYVNEVGSAWVQAQADPLAGHEIYLTRITLVEITAAIARRGKGGLLQSTTIASILTQFRYDAIHEYNILEITPRMLNLAERLAEFHTLRGYDAVQLAASMELHQARLAAGLSTLSLISADAELNHAAMAEGLTVDDPNYHP